MYSTQNKFTFCYTPFELLPIQHKPFNNFLCLYNMCINMVESVLYKCIELATLYHLRTFINIYVTEEPFMHLRVTCRALYNMCINMVESVLYKFIELATLFHLRTFITIYVTEEPFMHLTVTCRSLICCVWGGGGQIHRAHKTLDFQRQPRLPLPHVIYLPRSKTLHTGPYKS